MPVYELTVITRPLAKADLVNTLKRVATSILKQGSVIEECQSLGYRDLPYRMFSKTNQEHVNASNYFLFKSHMPLSTMQAIKDILKNDKDLVYFHALNTKELEQRTFDCNLADLLKPPAYRETVTDLRKYQHLSRKNKMHYTVRAKREWKAIPKSYFIAGSQK